jgi:hypothetical protein
MPSQESLTEEKRCTASPSLFFGESATLVQKNILEFEQESLMLLPVEPYMPFYWWGQRAGRHDWTGGSHDMILKKGCVASLECQHQEWPQNRGKQGAGQGLEKHRSAAIGNRLQ